MENFLTKKRLLWCFTVRRLSFKTGKKTRLCKVWTGWRMADRKMWMMKCGWKIANDTMQMIKSLRGKISLRCFLKVLVVNRSGHLIEVRPGEVQYFIFNHKTGQNIFTSAESKKKTDKPWSNNNNKLVFYQFYGQTPFFFHNIEGLSLSTIKPNCSAENRHCQIKWSTATIKL